MGQPLIMIHNLLNKLTKKLPYTDRFIIRLPSSTMGCGMLHEGNVYLMDYAIKNMPEGKYVLEIGSWAGLSTNLLLHLMQKYNRKEQFLGCDPWLYDYNDSEDEHTYSIEGREDISRAQYMDYIKKGFMDSVLLFNKSRLPYTFQLKSDEFFDYFNQKSALTDVFGRSTTLDGNIAFCYIDGNHSYEYVKRDFENTNKHLIMNGMVLFDDSYDGAPFGSAHFMREIKKNPQFKVIGKNPNYLIQKVA